jgi:hypothetical protein
VTTSNSDFRSPYVRVVCANYALHWQRIVYGQQSIVPRPTARRYGKAAAWLQSDA